MRVSACIVCNHSHREQLSHGKCILFIIARAKEVFYSFLDCAFTSLLMDSGLEPFCFLTTSSEYIFLFMFFETGVL